MLRASRLPVIVLLSCLGAASPSRAVVINALYSDDPRGPRHEGQRLRGTGHAACGRPPGSANCPRPGCPLSVSSGARAREPRLPAGIPW